MNPASPCRRARNMRWTQGRRTLPQWRRREPHRGTAWTTRWTAPIGPPPESARRTRPSCQVRATSYLCMVAKLQGKRSRWGCPCSCIATLAQADWLTVQSSSSTTVQASSPLVTADRCCLPSCQSSGHPLDHNATAVPHVHVADQLAALCRWKHGQGWRVPQNVSSM